MCVFTSGLVISEKQFKGFNMWNSLKSLRASESSHVLSIQQVESEDWQSKPIKILNHWLEQLFSSQGANDPHERIIWEPWLFDCFCLLSSNGGSKWILFTGVDFLAPLEASWNLSISWLPLYSHVPLNCHLLWASVSNSQLPRYYSRELSCHLCLWGPGDVFGKGE